MNLISKSKPLFEIMLPSFRGDQVYMHAFEIDNPSLPKPYDRWAPVVEKMISKCSNIKGTAYLTIDEKLVRQNTSHRRGGPHVDGNYLYAWSDEGSGWLTGENGRMLSEEKHRDQYCANTGGMLIVSSHEACKGWNGRIAGIPAQGGDCSRLDLSEMEEFMLSPNVVYWGNSTFVHESLPVKQDVYRQLVRITLPHTSQDI